MIRELLLVLLALNGCIAQRYSFGRRLGQAAGPLPSNSSANVTIAPGDLAVAASPDADAPVCPFELHAMYSGVAYMTITSPSLSQCCDSCKRDPKCNVYVYCSRQAGCIQGNQTTPYQQCEMKYQANINLYSFPPAISRSNTTNFTSGSFPTVQARAPAPAIAFPPGTSGNPNLVPYSLAEAPTLAEVNAIQQTCAFEDNANYKGDDYSAVNFTFAASLARCCAFCKASGGCNVYVYCGIKQGCMHEGITEPYQQCVLKYNSDVNLWTIPPAYSRGGDTNFTSGVNTFELALPRTHPPPIPPPPPSYDLASDNGGMFEIQPNSNYMGVLLHNTTVDSVAACGSACEHTARCNVFIFCPLMPGCGDGGNNTYPTGHCDLRFQAGLQQGRRPEQYGAERFRTIDLSSGTYFPGTAKSGPSTGVLVGSILGAVAFVALLAVLGIVVARRMSSVRDGRRESFWSWKCLTASEIVDPSPSNFKLMRTQDDILNTGQKAMELSRLTTVDCEFAPLNYTGGGKIPSGSRPAHFVPRRSRADRRILTARTVDHSIVPVFEGEQEEGMRIVQTDRLQDLWKIDPQDLTFEKRNGKHVKLGEGGHGVVFLGTLFGNTSVAIKAMERPDQKEQEAFAREIIFLKACRHPNLITFIGASEREDQTLLIMEYMPGDLYHRIRKDGKNKHLRWYNRGRSVALDICCGLTYLHSHGILHLDIKSPNILLSDNWTAKISDLGLSSTVTRDKDSANSIGASKWWASPEQILAAPCTTKADVFGLGTVIWELCTGETITERYLRPLRVPEEAPQEIEDLICACRANSAQDRPTAAEVHATITSSAAKVAP